MTCKHRAECDTKPLEQHLNILAPRLGRRPATGPGWVTCQCDRSRPSNPAAMTVTDSVGQELGDSEA